MALLDKINQLNQEMSTFANAMNTHQTAFTSLHASMITAVEKLNEEIRDIVLKNDELKAEMNTLSENTQNLETNIQALKQEQQGLQSKVSNQKEEQNQLTPKLEEYKQQTTSLSSQIESDTIKLQELEQKLQATISTRETTEVNTKSQIDAKQYELDTAKTESQDIIDKNVIWDFLKSKIDNPEIDILAIVAGTRNISSDEIKKRASSISAVLITRSISKLENDGKIVSTPQGNWDLAPPLLAELEK